MKRFLYILSISALLLTRSSVLVYAQESADTIQVQDTISVGEIAPVQKVSKKEKIKANIKKKGSAIYRFIKQFDDIDPEYILPNYYNYTAMLQNTNYFQVYKFRGRDINGNSQSLTIKPSHSIKVGPYFGWRWIFLGYTFDVGHPHSAGKSTELNLSLYSSMLGVDFVYIRNSGNFKLKKAVGFENVPSRSFEDYSLSGTKADIMSYSGYYVFNHHKFSYPAAYNQSTVQRKSCGSGMLGFGFSKQKLEFDHTQLPPALIHNDKLIEELKFNKVNYKYFYLSGGYAYNWVFAPNCMFSVSVMPTIGLRKEKNKKIQSEQVINDIKNLSFDCVSRAGLVWNNTHWFLGASYISNLYLYRKKNFSLTNSVNFLNIYFGFFFNRKSQYRSERYMIHKKKYWKTAQ